MTLYLQTKMSFLHRNKRLWTVLVLLFFVLFRAGAQSNADAVFVPIAKYLYEGDAAKLSAWFFDNVELSIDSNEYVMSRKQAFQMMTSFFEQYVPESFTIDHGASRSIVKCAVGKMVAGGEYFDVFIFVSNRGDGYKIQKLMFQKN
ncbi:MAG: DUF4783 domain-containing protein [Bacteroidales bacterium]|nr:DUF4783 domain-containing protein [Bacteroidales bacterium]MBQ1937869.1 DUF4783 domain-containing protein [Bacteroidales bacterium]MBQ2452039.1 DUF4783 domain-containing protein [Bacteroidales bacterium]